VQIDVRCIGDVVTIPFEKPDHWILEQDGKRHVCLDAPFDQLQSWVPHLDAKSRRERVSQPIHLPSTL
jgi:hypothetical protein